MGPPDTIIQPVKPADIPRLNEIDMSYASTFGYAYRLVEEGEAVRFELGSTEFEPAFERTYEWDWTELCDFTASVEKGLVWAAYGASGAPIGMVELRESEWNNALWIQSLFVDRSARKRGVGSRLLEAAIDFARSDAVRVLFVETQISNGPAIRFYRKNGFRPCGLNDRFYTNDDANHGEVALFLARETL